MQLSKAPLVRLSTLLAWFVVLVCLMITSTARAAAIRNEVTVPTLVITQTVTGPAQGVTSRLDAHLTSFSATRSRSATQLDTVATIPNAVSLRVRDFGTGAAQSDLLQQAREHINVNRPQLVSALTALMRERGVSSAVFNYDQQVSVAGTSRSKRLVWTMLLDQSSRALFGDAQLRDRQPLLLHVTYTPYAVASGLPAEWAYPEAGTLSWQLLNSRLQAQSERSTLDVHGAFDALATVPGTSHDPEAMLRCLIDARSRDTCPRDAPDVRRLLDQTGATSAIIDYVHQVSPVYNAVESPAGSGRFEQVARHTLRIDERTVSQHGCGDGASYRNVGAYGFLLRSRVDRYAVNATGASVRIASVAGTRLSPEKRFDVTRRVNANEAARIDGWIVNPADPDGALLSTASLQTTAGIAPVRNGASSNAVILNKTSGDWRNGRRSAVLIDCDRDSGMVRFIAGFAYGGEQQFIVPKYALFRQGQPASEYFETREDGPWAPCGAVAHYDGARTVQFEPNLTCAFGATMYRQLATLAPNVVAACPAGTFALAENGPSVCYSCPAGASLMYERTPGYVPTTGTRAVCESSNGWRVSQTYPTLQGPARFSVTW